MEQWTQYWQHTSALNSFAEGQSAMGYYGELRDFWHQQLQYLSPNANLLDIGTGNGALALLCYQYGAAKSYQWDLHAIDAADIKPQHNTYDDAAISDALSQIKFLGNTFTEDLPYEHQSFDLVCSQFALEYANLTLALPECLRVLKDNGNLVAMMHHQDSAIVADSRMGLAVLNLFLEQSNVFVQIKRLLMLASTLLLQGINVKSSAEFNQLNSELLQQFNALQCHFQDK
ncbi:MAG: class I SAM-dependent methyltransferase [Shewanella sp.]